jgi:hypothetical protein
MGAMDHLGLCLGPEYLNPRSWCVIPVLSSDVISQHLLKTSRKGPSNGFGRHISVVPKYQIRRFFMWSYVYSHLYDFALGSVKLGILAFYFRVFPVPYFQRSVLAFSTVIVAWIVGITVALGLVCTPIQRFWDGDVPGRCVNLVAFTYFTNIFNLVTDIMIFLMPMPLIYRLRVSRQQKLALAGLFAIGFVYVHSSIVAQL